MVYVINWVILCVNFFYGFDGMCCVYLNNVCFRRIKEEINCYV